MARWICAALERACYVEEPYHDRVTKYIFIPPVSFRQRPGTALRPGQDKLRGVKVNRRDAYSTTNAWVASLMFT